VRPELVTGMKTIEQANAYAAAWIEAWNARDLERVLADYADDVVFRSPRIEVVTGDKSGFVRGKAALRAYWRRGIELAPDLHFKLDRTYVGTSAVTICYRNHRGQNVAETLVFDDRALVVEGIVTHAPGET